MTDTSEPRREDIINTMKQYLRISLKFDAVDDVTGAEITETSMTETASAIAALSRPAPPDLHASGVEKLGRFLCEELALETFDEISKPKYMGDAEEILKFLALHNPERKAAASAPERTVDTTKLNAGQLVQRILRVLDHDLSTLTAAKLAEQIAAGILDLPADYWHRPAPAAESKPDTGQYMTPEEIASQKTPIGVDNLYRCNICGFIIDATYAAQKPSINFTMQGRTRHPSPDVRPLVKMPSGLHQLEHGAAATPNGCVAYFDNEADCLAFMEWIAAAPQPTDGGKS